MKLRKMMIIQKCKDCLKHVQIQFDEDDNLKNGHFIDGFGYICGSCEKDDEYFLNIKEIA